MRAPPFLSVLCSQEIPLGCHQKWVVKLGEWLCQEVVKIVPHRHVVFSIPEILRSYFLYERKLLSELSRCGWEALKTFSSTGVRDQKAVLVENIVLSGGSMVAIQSFRDFLGFQHSLHPETGTNRQGFPKKPSAPYSKDLRGGSALLRQVPRPLIKSRREACQGLWPLIDGSRCAQAIFIEMISILESSIFNRQFSIYRAPFFKDCSK